MEGLAGSVRHVSPFDQPSMRWQKSPTSPTPTPRPVTLTKPLQCATPGCQTPLILLYSAGFEGKSKAVMDDPIVGDASLCEAF